MEIELSRVIDAPADRLWSILLDPQKMSQCVPGMQSVEGISDTEYLATIKVKIAFISAKFNVRTVITEMTPPRYLKSESTGEDSAVGSSVKSTAEIFLEPQGDRTELRVKATATVLGRLGTLGLNPMKTKAERMWVQFCDNIEAELAGPADAEADSPAETANDTTPRTAASDARKATVQEPEPFRSAPQANTTPPSGDLAVKPGIFARLLGRASDHDTVRIEIRRNDTTVVMHWPVANADKCLRWLDGQLDPSGTR